ncbi:chaplin [Streptomyces sp. NRRL F-5126]|uniref:chaplin n=1 Tax=Streptomyces sp. NRRL F-5126 TaxID=1463857 RepID=UPI0004CC2018|nr:chaplin family protein [Streptomyces sp. NRRL F-5126]
MRDLISKGLLTAAAATSVLSLGGGYAYASDAQGAAAGSPGVLSGNDVQVPVEIPVNACGNTVDPIGVLNPAFGNTCANVHARHDYHPAYQGGHDARGDHASHAAGPGSDRAAAPQPHTLPAPAHKPMPRPDTHGIPGPEAAPQQHTRPQEHADHHAHQATHHRPTGATAGDEHAASGGGAQASGVAQGSPGLLSGNLTQAPLDIPVNACGNSVDVVGLLNPVFGNSCANAPAPAHVPTPPHHEAQPPAPHNDTPPVPAVHHPAPEHPAVPAAFVPQAPHVEQLAHTGADSHLLAAAAMSAGLMLGGGILYRRSTAAARARR